MKEGTGMSEPIVVMLCRILVVNVEKCPKKFLWARGRTLAPTRGPTHDPAVYPPQ